MHENVTRGERSGVALVPLVITYHVEVEHHCELWLRRAARNRGRLLSRPARSTRDAPFSRDSASCFVVITPTRIQ